MMDYEKEYSELQEELAWEKHCEEKYEEELKELGIKEKSEENIKSYYFTYGESAQRRINSCLKIADGLHNSGFYGSAVALFSTSAEIIIRYLVLRPLIQGAILSDEWAEILIDRITNGRSVEDRCLLPSVLKKFDIDITKIKLSNGYDFWKNFKIVITEKRNRFVHMGEELNKADSEIASELSERLISDVVYPIIEKYSFKINDNKNFKLNIDFYNKDYVQIDPFKNE
jgi:hypothetical protein